MRLTTPPLIGVAAISLATLVAIAAFAETPSGVTLSGLFDPDDSDLKPDAMGKLKDASNKAHRECYPPRVKFTVVVPGGADHLLAETLAKARVEALQHALPSLGLEPDQFKVGYVISVVDGVLVSYDKFNDDDKDSPARKVTWEPKKGTKVKAGDKIKVTIMASERYEDGHESWPTGVYNIQLIADDGLVDSKNYGRVPEPCERRTFEVTYTVPRNPPAIVHLTAIAEDAVGNNKDPEVGKFPTVEVWHGTHEYFYDITSRPRNEPGEVRQDAVREFVTFDLYETSKGKVEGHAHATWTKSGGLVTGACAGEKWIYDPKTVAWDAQLTGTVQHRPDGSMDISVQATPRLGPPYKVTNTPAGECTLVRTDQLNDNSWGGFSFKLKPGQDHYDEHYDIPLRADETGQKYKKIHVELSGK